MRKNRGKGTAFFPYLQIIDYFCTICLTLNTYLWKKMLFLPI